MGGGGVGERGDRPAGGGVGEHGALVGHALAERGVEQVGVLAKGRGRRSWLAEGAEAAIVRLTFTATPDDTSTHWSTRSLAAKVGVGKDTVARVWHKLGIKPWKVDTFKVSTD